MKHNEKEFVDLIEKIFNNEGYKTQREVIPDECKTWKFPWRIDLIVFYDSEIFGIEAKHINTLGQGSKLAQAFKQIQKYKKCLFEGKKINKWIIAPKFTRIHYRDIRTLEEDKIYTRALDYISSFIQTFFNTLHISFLELFDFDGLYTIKIDCHTKNTLEFICRKDLL